ncbi:hypothetical protein PanWU01x14_159500 [Parasponia andersonii]|uniref:Uncharacterized protein n=1 Tax=Parasponia andersonii TaxID=3476 RepID=A0A2P5CEE5_PARAD|nr:hypothetical protein PanWU01x14_159500 [Parasponia andersonii]
MERALVGSAIRTGSESEFVKIVFSLLALFDLELRNRGLKQEGCKQEGSTQTGNLQAGSMHDGSMQYEEILHDGSAGVVEVYEDPHHCKTPLTSKKTSRSRNGNKGLEEKDGPTNPICLSRSALSPTSSSRQACPCP